MSSVNVFIAHVRLSVVCVSGVFDSDYWGSNKELHFYNLVSGVCLCARGCRFFLIQTDKQGMNGIPYIPLSFSSQSCR